MAGFQKPKYDPEEVVYLRESAAIGHLEAYKIVNAQFTASGSVAYVLDTPVRSPTVATFGDMVGPPKYGPLILEESALVTYCDAVDLALVAAQRIVASLQAKKTSYCSDA